MPLNPEAVLAYISQHGPAVPNELRKAIGAQDNFVVGAILSELVASGKLALTELTHGTSKFYYDPARPELLEALGAHLGEKDRRAFELLKVQRVLRHSELTALNRVAMPAIGDFSRVLPVETPSGEERFWRYYLESEDTAFDLIVSRWFPSHAKKPAVLPATHAPNLELGAASQLQHVASPSVAPQTTPEAQYLSYPSATVPSTVTPQVIAPLAPSIGVPSVSTPEVSGRGTPRSRSAKTAKASSKEPVKQKRKPKNEVAPKEGTSRSPAPPSEFSQGIAAYFSVRNIRLDEDLGSSKSELTALVRVPSAIGEMRYYCKAKTKKITTDGDLASAFLEAQQRGLPLLYLAAGTLSKKAHDALPSLKGAVVTKPFSADTAEGVY